METLLISLKNSGYDIKVLTTCQRGDFHLELEKNGIQTFSNEINFSNSFVYYLKQWRFLILFCWQHKIDFLHSHLQHANIIAVLAQFFIKAKCTIFRHHCNFLITGGTKQNEIERVFDKIIHILSKRIIIPSYGVKREIELNETKNTGKYVVLPYIYNFSRYATPDPERVIEIRKKYDADLVLLFCSRFIDLKRPFVALNVLKKLIDMRINAKLLLLDDGPLHEEMENFIKENELSDNAHIIGFRQDYIDFFQASDILIHPSLTDASNSTVKEMALLEKCVIVCSETGDFDEYIINRDNGFLVSKENTLDEMVDIIVPLYKDKAEMIKIGSRLREVVIQKFSNSSEIIEQYIKYTL
jgi:glycosyltransferase involved in cell wall biosynthesis